MPEELAAEEAAGRLKPQDSFGIPLGTGQPPAFLKALGDRDDWQELRLYGALLSVWSEAYKHPNVHYLSGFYGPMERMLRDSGANISFAPADFRRFGPLFAATAPRIMASPAAPPDGDGYCSLSLHAGGIVPELQQAAADPERVLVIEVSENYPRTNGLPPEYRASTSTTSTS